MGRKIKWDLVMEGILEANVPYFLREKDTYKYIRKQLFKTAYKFFSPVLRGIPDFLVVETNYPDILKAGFYEVKFKDYQFTDTQQKFFFTFARAFNCYLIRVRETKEFQVFLCIIDSKNDGS